MKGLIVISAILIWVTGVSAYLYEPPPPGHRVSRDPSLLPPTESALAPFYKGEVDNLLTRDEARPHDFDVRKYILRISIDDESETVSGSTTVETVITADATDEMVFDLATELTVSQVLVNGSAAAFEHAGDLLTVTLDPPLDTSDPADVKITYSGSPSEGMYFEPDVIFTITEPSDSDHWYPCYDHPSDKADEGCELYITVDAIYTVASNGLLEDVYYSDRETRWPGRETRWPGRETRWPGRETRWPGIEKGRATATFHWRCDYTIATYLISVAISDYATFSHTWEGMPVDYFVYPDLLDEAEESYANTPEMLTCFKGLYGEYPFKNEKYGMAMTPLGGAMEHQTCTTMGDYWVHPAPEDDWIIAHELSHQWWGDWVTCGTWADIWLNEGFATYSDALFHEYSQGWDAFYNRMQDFKQYYFEEDEEYRFPIYDPWYMWSATVYEKGAWVLHMLRRLLGDDQFFAGLRYYGNAHAYDTAVTAELIDDMETYTGEELDWFFDEWVYLAGYPEFEYNWAPTRSASGTAASDRSQVTVDIRQLQEPDPLTPIFQTYVDLTADTPAGEETITVWVTDENEQFNLDFSDTVNNLYFDKYGWLLCKVEDATPITLDYFEAEGKPGGIELTWGLTGGYDVTGFNLNRRIAEKKETPVKVNAELITGEPPYRYDDGGLAAGETYSYTLEVVNLSGATETFGPATADAGPALPTEFELAQNAPNPTRGETTFRFALPADSDARLIIYDLAGRKIATILNEHMEAGEYAFIYDVALPPGVYVYRLTAGTNSAARKMVVIQ